MNDQHPILFSGAMVRAVLAGRKTQTRRLVDPQPEPNTDCPYHIGDGAMRRARKCPYGVPGDLLLVRETWREVSSAMMADGSIPSQPARCVYRADRPWDGPWRPSIHMPRWASRITLLVTGVRVERVQDITEDDAMAEGLEPGPGPDGLTTAKTEFWLLWDRMYSARGFGWAENPWVWVVEFRPLAALGESPHE